MRLRWNMWKGVSEGTSGPGSQLVALPWNQRRIAIVIADPNGGIYNAAGTLYLWGPWASVSDGSTKPGGIVTAVSHEQQLALFVADANGGVYTAAGTPDVGYGPWASVSEGSTTPGGTVTAVSYGSRLALFLADSNGGVYTTAGTPDAGWGPWASVSEGSSTPGGTVTAVPFGSGLALFLADPNGGVYTTAGTPDAGWGPWARVSEGSTTPGGTVTAVPYGSRLALFLADPNGGVYCAVGTPDTGWSPWSTLSEGATIAGAKVSVITLPWKTSVYAVFITDPNGGVYWTAGGPDEGWQGWTQIGGPPGTALLPGSTITPVIAYRQPGAHPTLALVATDKNGRVIYTNAEPPETPANLRVTGVSAHTIDLAWSSRRRHDFDGIRIRYRGTRTNLADHTGTESVNGITNTASLTGLQSGYTYTIDIVAFNGVGESLPSDPATATVPIVAETVDLLLVRQPVTSEEGAVFVPYLGKYPEFGQVPAGHLLKITLPADTTLVAGLNIVKRGHSTGECGSPGAVEFLARGQSTTAEQMMAIYGVSKLPYASQNPVIVLACAVITDPSAPIVNSVPVELTIISDGP